jgi:hypothetical protein
MYPTSILVSWGDTCSQYFYFWWNKTKYLCRTPILVSGAEAAKTLFLQAPEEIQSQYSLDQIIEQQKKMDAVKEVSIFSEWTS